MNIFQRFRRWWRNRRSPWMLTQDDWFYDPKKDPRVR